MIIDVIVKDDYTHKSKQIIAIKPPSSHPLHGGLGSGNPHPKTPGNNVGLGPSQWTFAPINDTCTTYVILWSWSWCFLSDDLVTSTPIPRKVTTKIFGLLEARHLSHQDGSVGWRSPWYLGSAVLLKNFHIPRYTNQVDTIYALCLSWKNTLPLPLAKRKLSEDLLKFTQRGV